MKKRTLLNNEVGLTLIEILVSLSILGMIIIGTMQFFSQALMYTKANEHKTVAINVARNALMYMENQNFIKMKDHFLTHPENSLFICNNKYNHFPANENAPLHCKKIKINNVDYDVTINANIDKDYESYMIPITVHVKWKGRKNDEQTTVEGVIKSEDIR